MDGLKQIMYGVTDFALMRAENGYFVDRTGLIREQGGTVKLHRIVLVFHGGDVALLEEMG